MCRENYSHGHKHVETNPSDFSRFIISKATPVSTLDRTLTASSHVNNGKSQCTTPFELLRNYYSHNRSVLEYTIEY